MTEPTLEPIRWQVRDLIEGFSVFVEVVRTKAGGTLYAIRNPYGDCLSREMKWDDEPLPSNRSAEFLASHRFESLEEVLELVKRWHATIESEVEREQPQ